MKQQNMCYGFIVQEKPENVTNPCNETISQRFKKRKICECAQNYALHCIDNVCTGFSSE